ncbi:MAG: ribosome small subunit-dependent GTPase A [Clostridia bacterium]|nr:ribosome small subunit-dependent GTPase A [Clostridia bacterium]
MLTGTIIKGIGGFYYVKTESGCIECRSRGKFRQAGETPLVGDLVHIQLTAEDASKGSVEEILPRKNVFIRPPVANIDQLIITVAAKNPEPNLLLVDQLAITAEAADVRPVICVNKLDLDEDFGRKITSIYEKAGYPVVSVSARENWGMEALREILKDKTTAFAGNSGVGKSSLLNQLCDYWGLATGDVSEKTKRGRHTTRHTELFKLPFGGYVFDTPGFSSYEAGHVTAEMLSSLFPEMVPYEADCRFKGCAHVAEPGCAVKEAVETGAIAKERYDNYCILYAEAKNQKKW